MTISYERVMEEEMAGNAAEFQAIFNSISDAVIYADTNRRIVMVNPAFTKIFGYSSDEVLGRETSFLYANLSDFKEQGIKRYNPNVQENSSAYEMEYRKKDGSIFLSETLGVAVHGSKGELRGYLGIIRDITDRKIAEEERRKNQETLEGIMRAVPFGLCLVRDRVFSWVSPRMFDITGYRPDELVGTNVRIFYCSEEEYLRVGKAYDRLLTDLEAEIESEWRKKDGTLIKVLLRGSTLEPGDVSRGVIISVMDITDRKKAEEEKEKFQRKMQHVQKLESLGVLAGGIAHDFNNLLTSILGNADLALMELSPLSGARQYIKAIEVASRRASDLCRQMLAYSGRGKFVVEKINLNDLVEEMLHMLEISISKKAVLRLHLSDNAPAIEADPSQISQVIMNLVINASEAIGKRSGIISITTGAMDCDRKYLSGTYLDENLPEGPYSYIEVADTGCGMDEETRNRMFEPFFTTKFTGRGLGMAAVLGIVRGHGGCIKIYSEKGQGTTIKVLFPSVPLEAVRCQEKTRAGGSLRGGTVLLVDDEDTVRAVGRQMLERLGFSVVTASDGEEAVKFFAKTPDVFDCVLLDLTMPNMDGEETFRELRRISPEVKVIMSSGYNEQEVTQRFVGKNIADFIQKPYRIKDLADVLSRVLQEGKAT